MIARRMGNISTHGDASLVFHLPMDEAPDSVVYDTANGLEVTNNGTQLSTSQHPSVKSASWYFGNSNTLTLALGERLANVFNSNLGTVCFWGYRNGTTDGQFARIIEYHTSGTWRLSQGGDFNADWFSGAEYWVPGISLSTHTWYHCAMVSDGNSVLKCYLNGTLRNTKTSTRGTPNISPTYNSGYIGKGCYMSDMRVYNRALATEEILSIYNNEM